MVLTDGWITHTHYLAVAGFALMIYSMWRMTMKTPEDEAFEEMEKALGWRKRQIVQRQLSDEENIARNVVLEEIATAFDKMRNGGDTVASFAIYVRSMKR
jgi:ADP-ribosylglycohydrolase